MKDSLTAPCSCIQKCFIREQPFCEDWKNRPGKWNSATTFLLCLILDERTAIIIGILIWQFRSRRKRLKTNTICVRLNWSPFQLANARNIEKVKSHAKRGNWIVPLCPMRFRGISWNLIGSQLVYLFSPILRYFPLLAISMWNRA